MMALFARNVRRVVRTDINLEFLFRVVIVVVDDVVFVVVVIDIVVVVVVVVVEGFIFILSLP